MGGGGLRRGGWKRSTCEKPGEPISTCECLGSSLSLLRITIRRANGGLETNVRYR